jgi:hypothetical protein
LYLKAKDGEEFVEVACHAAGGSGDVAVPEEAEQADRGVS